MTVRVIVDAHNAASISRIFYTPGSVTNNRKRAASACHFQRPILARNRNIAAGKILL